ncbi:hypothetical protein F4825DRAFT_247396 [Nemania diffusa]|nr:hypothetical protein F4825DRAFT_247396 [Nemania diffusa]
MSYDIFDQLCMNTRRKSRAHGFLVSPVSKLMLKPIPYRHSDHLRISVQSVANRQTPLTRGPIHCFDEDNFPGHEDVSPSAQEHLSQIFSNLDTQVDTIGLNGEDVTLHGTDQHSISYDYSTSWVDSWVIIIAEQNFGFPLRSPSLIAVYLLIWEDYIKCNNSVVGSSCQAGCLPYTPSGALEDQRAQRISPMDRRGKGISLLIVEIDPGT